MVTIDKRTIYEEEKYYIEMNIVIGFSLKIVKFSLT